MVTMKGKKDAFLWDFDRKDIQDSGFHIDIIFLV